jgi:hypothetical protein
LTTATAARACLMFIAVFAFFLAGWIGVITLRGAA